MNKAIWRTPLLAALLVSGLLACTRAPASPEADRAALQAAINRWVTAVNAQDLASLTATMTEDVELVDDTAATTGRDAALPALRAARARGRLVITSREISIAGDVGWHLSGLAWTSRSGDLQAGGQALEIWKRVKGEWRLHRRMVTGDIPPELSITRPSTKEPVLDKPKN